MSSGVMNANQNTRKLFVGLTGGIGSGKSTVAGLLADVGATVIDTDAISRELTGPGGHASAAIAASFGAAFVSLTGAMDREKMRAFVFSDPLAKRKLEALLHPLIGAQTRERAQAATTRFVVFDVPLLVESLHWRARVDCVWVVDCAPETQVQRVMARSGWSRQAVEQVIAAQASREQRARAADAVIYNDGIDLASLQQQLESLLTQTRTRFGL
jgi:dephospho-CoA kinase